MKRHNIKVKRRSKVHHNRHKISLKRLNIKMKRQSMISCPSKVKRRNMSVILKSQNLLIKPGHR